MLQVNHLYCDKANCEMLLSFNLVIKIKHTGLIYLEIVHILKSLDIILQTIY